jgi:uncharacterized protein (TIGR03086 family)
VAALTGAGLTGAGLTDGFRLLEGAVSYALVNAALVTPGLLSRATPCADWDLGMLLDHVSDSLDALHEAISAGCTGWRGPASGAGRGPELAGGLRRRAGKLLAACAAAGPRDHPVAIADRDLPASVVAVTGAIEIAVHGWDIRVACGASRPIPPGLAAGMLPIAPSLLTSGSRDGLFAAPVPVPPLTSPGDQLVAFLGRHPGWPGTPP